MSATIFQTSVITTLLVVTLGFGQQTPDLQGLWVNDDSLQLGLGGTWGAIAEKNGTTRLYFGVPISSTDNTCNVQADQVLYNGTWVQSVFQGGTAALITTFEYCEHGIVTSPTWSYASSSSNDAICPGPDAPYTNMTRFDLDGIPNTVACTVPPSLNTTLPSLSPSPSNFTLPVYSNIGGIPPFMLGYWISQDQNLTDITINTPTSLSAIIANLVDPDDKINEAFLVGGTGNFTSFECLGPYKAVGVVTQTVILPTGEVGESFETCDLVEYDPDTQTLKGYSSQDSCVTELTAEMEKQVAYLKFYKELNEGPALGTCVNVPPSGATSHPELFIGRLMMVACLGMLLVV